jgi:hypothetical protein
MDASLEPTAYSSDRGTKFARFVDAAGAQKESPIWSGGVKPRYAYGLSLFIAVLLCLFPWGDTAQSSAPKPNSSKAAPLVAPKTTPVEDARYLTDVTKADPDLATYVQQQGDLALKTMLTDGAAFCAFLHRGGGIDAALLNVAAGAKSVESKTHLPASVATFNSIEAVALIDLCPAEQKLVPASVRTKLHRLRSALGKTST